MKPCAEHREAIAHLAMGHLDSRTAETVRRHADACPPCQEALNQLTSLARQLGSSAESSRPTSPAPSLPTGFHDRLRLRLQEEISAQTRTPAVSSRNDGERIQPGFWTKWFSLPRLAGAMAMVIVLSLWIWRPAPERAGSSLSSHPVTVSPQPRVLDPGPPPTLLAMSRALQDSMETLEQMLARHEDTLAANDPPTRALGLGSESIPE